MLIQRIDEGEIELGQTVRGQVEPNIQYTWTFRGNLNQILIIEFDGGTTASLKPLPTLKDSDGRSLLENIETTDANQAIIKNFILPYTDTYTILVQGAEESEGQYNLALVEGTAEPITIGQTITSTIGGGQVWSFKGEANQLIKIAMNGLDDGVDSYLTLKRSDDATLGKDDDGGLAQMP